MRAVLFLDIGHGYGDPGALAKDTTEFDMVTALHARLVPMLEKLDFKVLGMKQKPNRLEDRGLAARGCDAFMSLHLNAGPKGIGLAGSEVYFLNTNDKVSGNFARTLSLALATHLQISDRGPKLDNLGVLRGAAAAKVPLAVLCEPFFIQDATKEQMLPLLDKAATASAATFAGTFPAVVRLA